MFEIHVFNMLVENFFSFLDTIEYKLLCLFKLFAFSEHESHII